MTHEDALQASRSVMKQALAKIANDDPTAREIAGKALVEEHERYKAGVLVASD